MLGDPDFRLAHLWRDGQTRRVKMREGERRADRHAPLRVEAHRREVEKTAAPLRDEVEETAVGRPARLVGPRRLRRNPYPSVLRSSVGRGYRDTANPWIGQDFRYEHKP